MQLRKYITILILCLLCSYHKQAAASHVVGGEMSYTCNNGIYTITLTVYRDCLDGEQGAFSQDNPAYIGIFSLDPGSTFSIVDTQVYAQVDEYVRPEFENSCINNYPTVCLNRLKFVKTIALPANTSGYRIVYTRCCRNASVININRPDRTGATYTATIPALSDGACNNSAQFPSDLRPPPQIICINNPFVYNHSAKISANNTDAPEVDADGDSLSYEFCSGVSGGTQDNAKPIPGKMLPGLIDYRSPYTAKRPMLGNPLIRIDPRTGMITGTPTTLGRFIVTVCCHEWRNGQLINTVSREFQYVVTDCSKAVLANMPQYSDEQDTYIVECTSKTVKFENTSQGATSYLWEFGVPGAVSTEREPTYTYPDTGIYRIKLTINPGSTCADSIKKLVKVFPDYSADYRYTGDLCPNSPIHFEDLSTATYPPIVAWDWDFKDGERSAEQDPAHTYKVGGYYDVTLISTSVKGCKDTAVKTLFVDNFVPFGGNDTIIVKGEKLYFNASGGIAYEWSPPDLLSNPFIPDPFAYYPDTGRYIYTLKVSTAIGCIGYDTIDVWVVDKASIYVPSAFSPNGDGLNDFLKPLGAGYRQVRFFRVFNRFGQLVFDGKDFRNGWDGKFKGMDADVGTYFWVLGVTNRFGQDEQIKGDVTLIR